MLVPFMITCAAQCGFMVAAQPAPMAPHFQGRLTLAYLTPDGQDTKPGPLNAALNKDLGWVWLWYLEPGLDNLPLEREKWESFSKARQLPPGSEWALLPREEAKVDSGGPVPSGARLWDELHGAGVGGGPYSLTTFLQSHASSGEGWATMGLGAVALQAARLRQESLPASRPSRGSGSFTPIPELLDSLKGLSHTEDWATTTAAQRLFGGPLGMSFLLRWKKDAVPGESLEEVALPMYHDVVEALEEDPTNLGLRASYRVLVDLVPGQDPLTPLFAIPTDPMLPNPWAWANLWAEPLVHRKAWSQLRELASEGWDRNPQPDLDWAQEQMLDGPEDRVQGWGRYKLMALCGLGREDEAKAWIEVLRSEAGENWNPQDPDLNAALRRFPETPGQQRLVQALAMGGIKQAKSQKAPKAEQLNQVVLYLSGPEKDIENWPKLASFAFWARGELRWKMAPGLPKAGVTYRIWRGAEQLGEGQLEDPNPVAMAQILATIAPSRIHKLEALVQRFPQYRPALRNLVKEVLGRMPNPNLEADLLRWMRQLREAPPIPGGDGWKPDPNLWSPWVRNICDQCEFRLAEFPTDRETWRTWKFWNALASRPASVVDLVERLPHWQPWTMWAAGLPSEMIDALVKDMFTQGFNEELQELALNLKSHPQTAAWRADRGTIDAATQAILQRILKTPSSQFPQTP